MNFNKKHPITSFAQTAHQKNRSKVQIFSYFFYCKELKNVYFCKKNVFLFIMKNKTQRLLQIKKIITSQKIASQEELLKKLEEEGFAYTQATLSRDLKFLKVSRVVDEGLGYVYKLPKAGIPEEDEDIKYEFTYIGFKSLKFSNNFGVIKTLPGYAQGIASFIDGLEIFEILGTIAGDDTILLIPAEGVTKNDIINSLKVAIPPLKDKIL